MEQQIAPLAAAEAAVTPLLVIGAGRAALAFVSRLPPERLRGVLGACRGWALGVRSFAARGGAPASRVGAFRVA